MTTEAKRFTLAEAIAWVAWKDISRSIVYPSQQALEEARNQSPEDVAGATEAAENPSGPLDQVVKLLHQLDRESRERAGVATTEGTLADIDAEPVRRLNRWLCEREELRKSWYGAAKEICSKITCGELRVVGRLVIGASSPVHLRVSQNGGSEREREIPRDVTVHECLLPQDWVSHDGGWLIFEESTISADRGWCRYIRVTFLAADIKRLWPQVASDHARLVELARTEAARLLAVTGSPAKRATLIAHVMQVGKCRNVDANTAIKDLSANLRRARGQRLPR